MGRIRNLILLLALAAPAAAARADDLMPPCQEMPRKQFLDEMRTVTTVVSLENGRYRLAGGIDLVVPASVCVYGQSLSTAAPYVRDYAVDEAWVSYTRQQTEAALERLFVSEAAHGQVVRLSSLELLSVQYSPTYLPEIELRSKN